MASLQRVEKENIEKARQLLLLEVYREQNDDRFVKREAVKQLLAPLIAARESGLSFEDIAKVFEKAGLVLTPSTLRSYYFELKTEADLATSARKHAEKVAQTKRAIDQQMLEKHNRHADRVALAHATRLNQSPKLIDALAQTDPSALPPPGPAQGPVSAPKPGARPPLAAAAPTPAEPPESARVKREGGKVAAAEPASSHAPDTADPTPTDQVAAGGASHRPAASDSDNAAPVVKTLAEIEQLSLATDDRTVLEDDVIVKGDLVLYVSGKPFVGTLSKKQIHLLRSVGKIIAPTTGRSSSDFVKMPSKL